MDAFFKVFSVEAKPSSTHNNILYIVFVTPLTSMMGTGFVSKVVSRHSRVLPRRKEAVCRLSCQPFRRRFLVEMRAKFGTPKSMTHSPREALQPSGTHCPSAIINLIKTTVGAVWTFLVSHFAIFSSCIVGVEIQGILALPFAFARVGLGGAIVLSIFVALLTAWTFHFVYTVAAFFKVYSFGEVARVCLGLAAFNLNASHPLSRPPRGPIGRSCELSPYVCYNLVGMFWGRG